MKKIFNLAALLLFIIVSAQKPEFKNQPSVLQPDGSLTKLETQTAESKIKVKGLGYGGVETRISVAGETSNVKVSKTPTFYIWVDEGVDPTTLINLSTMKVSNKKRSVPLTKTSSFAMYGATGKSMAEKYNVPFKIEKVQDSVYKITPESPLESGMQYCFYNPEKTQSQQIKIFLFGVE